MSEQIKSAYKKQMAPLFNQMLEAPWENKHFYANWLAQTHGFVTQSTRLIAMAGSLFSSDKLHMRFIDHAREERNHEILLVNDLKHLGFAIKDLPTLPETAGFYQSQVYWMLLKDPAAFFGYILCLEGLAVEIGPQLYERTLKEHGAKAANFLKVHADEDVEHLDKAFEMLKGLTAEQEKLVEQNLSQCIGLYSAIVSACQEAGRSHRIAA